MAILKIYGSLQTVLEVVLASIIVIVGICVSKFLFGKYNNLICYNQNSKFSFSAHLFFKKHCQLCIVNSRNKL